MKAITHLAFYALSAAALVGSACHRPHESPASPAKPLKVAETLKGWSDDLTKGLEQAKQENKPVLVEFTGSDWCPPCKMMRKEVFSKSEFVDAASKKFILVEIDMPRGDKEVSKKNQPLVEKYKVDGFPTVLLLNSAGKEFGRFYASEHPKTEDFLKRLDKELDKKDLD